MPGMSSSDYQGRIIEVLRVASMPLDDDQLAEQVGISPRQTVNRICRALEQTGALRRYTGPGGKIVSELVHQNDRVREVTQRHTAGDVTAATKPGDIVSVPAGHPTPPGSSQEQRDAERIMLDLLSRQLGRGLNPATITVRSGARVEVDGVDADRTVLVECWAHQGSPKSAQRHKVLADAFKLTWVSSTMYPRPRLILCLSHTSAAAPFIPGSRSWAALALQDLGIDICLVDLPDEIRQGLLKAQQRQHR
jgi:hypothetical protein